MLRRALPAALAGLLLAAAPAAAGVRVEVAGGAIQVQADAATPLATTVAETATHIVFTPAAGPWTPGTGCAAAGAEVQCQKAARVDIRSGATADTLRVGALSVPLAWQAGGGADTLATDGPALAVSLDGIANDTVGGGPASSNAGPDVENLQGGPLDDVLVGSPAANELTGGGGADAFEGGAGADVIFARDGIAEAVDCGGEPNDVATLDPADVHAGCPWRDVAPYDGDGDGVAPPADCDDSDAGVRPGAIDLPDDNRDQDCDGSDPIDFDRDGDGVPRPRDCDDTSAGVNPGRPELPGNRVDENCDGRREPFPAIGVKLRQATGASSRGTRFLVLKVVELRRQDRIAVLCRGRGCPFRSRAFAAPRTGLLNLRRRAFANRRIRAGGRVTIRVTDARGVSKQFAFEMRRAEAPIFVTRCASPPDNRLRRC